MPTWLITISTYVMVLMNAMTMTTALVSMITQVFKANTSSTRALERKPPNQLIPPMPPPDSTSNGSAMTTAGYSSMTWLSQSS